MGGELHFAHGELLGTAATLVAAVFLASLWHAWRRHRVLRWSSRTLPGSIYSTGRIVLAGFLTTAAVSVIAGLLLQPYLRTQTLRTEYEPLHIVIATDASFSMLSQATVEPCGPSRLRMAQNEIFKLLDFLQERKTDKVALVMFTRFGYRLIPVLTTDYNAVRKVLGEFTEAEIASGGLLSGTNHWDAVKESTIIFEPGSRSKRILIIVTDGEEDGPPEILKKSREEALKAKSELGEMSVYIVAIGESISYPFPIPLKKEANGCPAEYMVQKEGEGEGTIVMSQSEPWFIRALAVQMGGEYIRAWDGNELTEALRNIVERERISISQKALYTDRDLSRELLLALLAVLVLLVIVKSP